MKNDRFYFDGMIYSDQEKFDKSRSEWIESATTPLSRERMLQRMCQDISLDLLNTPDGPHILSNYEFSLICFEFSLKFIDECRQRMSKNLKDPQ